MLGTSLTLAANAQDLIDRTPAPAKVYDLEGNLLDRIITGHQVVLSKTFTNSKNLPQPYVALFEVRDSDGVSVYLAWQTGTMEANGQMDVGISWIADGSIGEYEIRTFLISNFTNPEVLDVVEARSIMIVNDADT